MRSCGGGTGGAWVGGGILCLSALVVLLLTLTSSTSAAVGTTYSVDTTDGATDGICGGASDCSLGDAITAANANTGKDTIAFAVPGPGPHLIVLPALASGPFPTVTDALVIDGETQPGYAGTPRIEIDVSGRLAFGLLIQGASTAGSEIRGLAIYGSTSGDDNAIDFDNPGGNVVERNYIGLEASGTVVKGRGGVAFRRGGSGDGLVSSDNLIADNVIAVLDGAALLFDEASDSQVRRNLIGTDPTGENGLSTGTGVGIALVGGSSRNLISRNVIAREQFGISISGSADAGSADNRVEGNHIGTDLAGEIDLGNRDGGISITGNSDGTIIGGADPGQRNVISGNGGDGIDVFATGVVVQGNLIGTDASGVSDLGNDGAGVIAAGDSVLVADNVVSGNGGVGIRIGDSAAHTGIRVERNLIGTDATGTTAIPNDSHGILTASALTDSFVGGESQTQRNVVSGNGGAGIVLASPGVQVLSNYVGTDVSGENDLGNGEDGVRLSNGAALGKAGAGNVVSGNGGAGVVVGCCLGVDVQANLIGTDKSGTQDLGNDGSGVSIDNSAPNRIGGPGPEDGNTVAFNAGHGIVFSLLVANSSLVQRNLVFSNGADGVAVVGAAATRNAITENSVFGNGGLGIDLGDDGVTPNDVGDGDSGANLRQNFPVNMQVSANGTTVTGTLNSRPNTSYRVELFGNTLGVACDPSGNGEGERFLQAADVMTDGSGNASFSVPLQTALPGGEFVTATTTDPAGNTSEFSQCVQAPPRATIVVRKTTEPAGANEFVFTGDVAGMIGDGQTLERLVTPGTYSSTEEVPPGWDLTRIVCDDSDSTGSGATATFRASAGERVTCTFTNTGRGSVRLVKTTDGLVDASKDILFVLTGPGLPSAGITRSTFGDQDGVLDFGSASLVPGQTYTICETAVPAGFTSFWKLDGVIVTPYNPDASKSPPEDLGARCYDFSVSPGQTRAFEVDNSHPGGHPRTIGYWKNWNRCTGGNQPATAAKNGGAAAGFFLVEDLLPQRVGDFSITTCEQAVRLLSKQDRAGKNKASDAAYELGAQLLAARFNLGAGAETCPTVQQAALDAQTLLDSIDFTGSGDILGSKSKDPRRSQALALAGALDRYNNGTLC